MWGKVSYKVSLASFPSTPRKLALRSVSRCWNDAICRAIAGASPFQLVLLILRVLSYLCLPFPFQVLDAPKFLISNTIVPFRFNLGSLDFRRQVDPRHPRSLSLRIVCMNATSGDNVCTWPENTSLNANSLGVSIPAFDYAAKSAPVLDISLVSKDGPNSFFVKVPYLIQGPAGAVDGSGGGAYVCLILLTQSLRRDEVVQVSLAQNGPASHLAGHVYHSFERYCSVY